MFDLTSCPTVDSRVDSGDRAVTLGTTAKGSHTCKGPLLSNWQVLLILLALIPLKGHLIGTVNLFVPGLHWEGVLTFAWEIRKGFPKTVTFEIASKDNRCCM